MGVSPLDVITNQQKTRLQIHDDVAILEIEQEQKFKYSKMPQFFFVDWLIM